MFRFRVSTFLGSTSTHDWNDRARRFFFLLYAAAAWFALLESHEKFSNFLGERCTKQAQRCNIRKIESREDYRVMNEVVGNGVHHEWTFYTHLCWLLLQLRNFSIFLFQFYQLKDNQMDQFFDLFANVHSTHQLLDFCFGGRRYVIELVIARFCSLRARAPPQLLLQRIPAVFQRRNFLG